MSSTAIDPNWKMIVLAYSVDKFTLQKSEKCYFWRASISGRRGHLWLPSGLPGATGMLGLSSGPFRLFETSLKAFKTHSNISLHRKQTGGAYGRPGVFGELWGRSGCPLGPSGSLKRAYKHPKRRQTFLPTADKQGAPMAAQGCSG